MRLAAWCRLTRFLKLTSIVQLHLQSNAIKINVKQKYDFTSTIHFKPQNAHKLRLFAVDRVDIQRNFKAMFGKYFHQQSLTFSHEPVDELNRWFLLFKHIELAQYLFPSMMH
jgi:hypothetical protein